MPNTIMCPSSFRRMMSAPPIMKKCWDTTIELLDLDVDNPKDGTVSIKRCISNGDDFNELTLKRARMGNEEHREEEAVHYVKRRANVANSPIYDKYPSIKDCSVKFDNKFALQSLIARIDTWRPTTTCKPWRREAYHLYEASAYFGETFPEVFRNLFHLDVTRHGYDEDIEWPNIEQPDFTPIYERVFDTRKPESLLYGTILTLVQVKNDRCWLDPIMKFTKSDLYTNDAAFLDYVLTPHALTFVIVETQPGEIIGPTSRLVCVAITAVHLMQFFDQELQPKHFFHVKTVVTKNTHRGLGLCSLLIDHIRSSNYDVYIESVKPKLAFWLKYANRSKSTLETNTIRKGKIITNREERFEPSLQEILIYHHFHKSDTSNEVLYPMLMKA